MAGQLVIGFDPSAPFLLIRKKRPDKMLAELSGFKERIIRFSMSSKRDERAQVALSSTYPVMPERGRRCCRRDGRTAAVTILAAQQWRSTCSHDGSF
jgi:hypothetical protein